MTCTATIRRLCPALWLVLALFVPFTVSAQVAVPPLLGHITDLTGTLAPDQKSALEQTLAAFEARKGSQLAVLMVPTTEPEDIAQFSLRVAEQWKLGRKKVDDGVVLVVAKNDRALRIEVGYGLEGALSDITSKRIISETISPRFRQGDFYGGVAAGVDQIIRVVDGEPLPEPKNSASGGNLSIRQFVPFLFIVALAVGGVLRRAFGQVAGSVITGAVVTVLAWFVAGTLLVALLAGVAAMFVTLIGVGRMQHGVGGFSGGGRGDFGGGGGFGGGGASGRW